VTDLEKLLAIEEIKQLKAHYFRAIDTKSFEELRNVFAPDGEFDATDAVRDPVKGAPEGSGELPVMKGIDNIVAIVTQALTPAQSAHHGHIPEITITSDTTATGIVPMEDVVLNGGSEMRGFGHYHETYEKIDGKWFIKTSKLTRLRVVFTPME